MPYIEPYHREHLSDPIECLLLALQDLGFYKGNTNYVITQLVIGYIKCHEKSYDTLSDVTGILNDVKTEFERRVVAPYEDEKMVENGDVGYEHI